MLALLVSPGEVAPGLPPAVHPGLFLSVKGTVSWSLRGDSGVDNAGTCPSSCLLPERIAAMIDPFSPCSWQVQKHLLEVPGMCVLTARRGKALSP